MRYNTVTMSMPNDLSTTKSSKFYAWLISISVIVLCVVLAIAYFKIASLNNNELNSGNPTPTQGATVPSGPYQGRVTYVNPAFYPNEKISYVLTGADGKDIILLRATDQRLSIAEGLTVKLTGIVVKTSDGKHAVLQVDKVEILNGSN